MAIHSPCFNDQEDVLAGEMFQLDLLRRRVIEVGGDPVDRETLLQRISIDPNVCFGKPCIRGHRIWVSLILDMLAGGQTTAEILHEYPGLEEADLLACIAWGAEMSRDRFIDIPLRRPA